MLRIRAEGIERMLQSIPTNLREPRTRLRLSWYDEGIEGFVHVSCVCNRQIDLRNTSEVIDAIGDASSVRIETYQDLGVNGSVRRIVRTHGAKLSKFMKSMKSAWI